MTVEEILQRLESLGTPENIAGMTRFAITAKKAFGVSAPDLKRLAKEIKKETNDRHALAQELWTTEIHEARAIAYLIDNPRDVTETQMEDWVKDFDNWAICDSTCGTLFCRTPFAYEKVFAWAERDEEFVKRAGFALIAWLAVHDKGASDEKFIPLLELIEDKCDDKRNFIKKAVNWALRQIGKRNLFLNELAAGTARKIQQKDSKAARWIASDALRELTNEKTIERLKIKAK